MKVFNSNVNNNFDPTLPPGAGNMPASNVLNDIDERRPREPDQLGDALMLLAETSSLTRLTFKGQHGPAGNAAKAARSLIAAYTA
jgi:hypothetical protein